MLTFWDDVGAEMNLENLINNVFTKNMILCSYARIIRWCIPNQQRYNQPLIQ